MCTHTHAHIQLSDGPPVTIALYPNAQCSNFRFRAKRWEGRDRWNLREKFLLSPTLLGPEGFGPCSSGGLGVRPEWAGTPGHPALP